MKKEILFSFFLLSSIIGNAQNGQVGDWIDYLPYHNVFSIAVGPNVTYGATTHGLIEYHPQDKSVTRFSKVMGLSDIGISCIGYNKAASTFLIGYSNGTIDLITENEIITISDLNRKTISGNKSLNNIYMDSVFAYIATGFGVIKFNVLRQEFAETYLVTSNGDYIFVNDVTIANDSIYASTVSGVKKAYLNDPQITFYESWEPETSLPFPNASYDIIASNADTLYLNYPISSTEHTLYTKTPNSKWEKVNNLVGNVNKSIAPYNNKILISHESEVIVYDHKWNEIDRIYDYGKGLIVDSRAAILGINDEIWIGDQSNGMIYNPKPFKFEIINPESPAKANVDEIDIHNNQIAIAAGIKLNNWNPTFNNDGIFYRNSTHSWGQTTKFNDSGLEGIYDLITIKINPFNPNIIYAGSMGNGLVEFTNNKVTNVYNTTNSTLQTAIGIDDIKITGTAFDSQGNLWVANSLTPTAISVLTTEKKWIGFSFPQYIPEDKTGDLIIDQQGYKWLILPHSGQGILVFNDNNTIDDLSDDQAKVLKTSTGSGALPSTDIYSIAEDKDGEIWVGTGQGIAVFYSPTSIFTEGANYDAQKIIVEFNGHYQYLLSTETVTAIGIDGANRKWFGTKGSGIFLMSADGTQQLLHFTSENSPLLSNFIRTIKINNVTGEVMIGTDEGIVAYKGSATDIQPSAETTYAYPNPVPENYFGTIAINGLPSNAEVRITDIAGNMVFTTRAEGTQAIWDGNNMNGQRVGTGIYLVFGIDTEGNQSQVAKIMFTR